MMQFTRLGLPLLLGLAPALLAAPPSARIYALRTFQQQTSGVSYQFGSCTSTAMDCSCFIQRLFADQFGYFLPRTTLAQASRLAGKRVSSIVQPSQLTDQNLCVGDLIYSHARDTSWEMGPRHVVVYAGGGRVLHASPSNQGVGTSSLKWIRRRQLHGVYRPLGCDGDQEPRSTPARPGGERTTPTGVTGAVRAVIDRYFTAWETRDIEQFRRCWSLNAVQWDLGEERNAAEIINHRKESFRSLVVARVDHRYESMTVWANHAIVEVGYSLEQRFRDHTRQQEDLRDSFTLQRHDDTWRILYHETYLGD